MTLKDLEVGDRCKIEGFTEGCRKYRARLLAQGLTKGTTVELIRMAPMGDPIEIELRGFRLTLRRDEAEVVLVDHYHPNLERTPLTPGRHRRRRIKGHHYE